MKKIVALFLVFVLVFGLYPVVGFADDTGSGDDTGPPNYEISHLGIPVDARRPEALEPGQVWAGISIEYLKNLTDSHKADDGLVQVTIYVWGKPYSEGILLDDDNPNVLIRADIGDFELHSSDTNLPSESTGNILEWSISQDNITPDPFKITYTLCLGEGPWDPEQLYKTGLLNEEADVAEHSGIEVRFRPAQGNGYYWTKRETLGPEFTLNSISWNAGTKGLNNAVITDFSLGGENGLSISFPKGNSNSQMGVMTATAPSDHWNTDTGNYKAIAGSTNYAWHLQWRVGLNPDLYPQTYRITVRGLRMDENTDALIDVTYEITVNDKAGNQSDSSPFGTILTSVNYFGRSQFEWGTNSNVILRPIGDAEVMIADSEATPSPTGTLTVKKDLVNMSEEEWEVNSQTEFSAILYTIDDEHELRYVRLMRTKSGEYAFLGFDNTSRDQITFSVDQPATITGLPVHKSPDGASRQYFIEEILDQNIQNTIFRLIDTRFSVNDGNQTDVDKSFTLSVNSTTNLTVHNFYERGFGSLVIHKLFHDFYYDAEKHLASEFYVRVWDKSNSNYLLFVPDPDDEGAFRPFDNASDESDEERSDSIIPTMEILITPEQSVRLSNLPAGYKYQVREVFIVGDEQDIEEMNELWNSLWEEDWVTLDWIVTDWLHLWGEVTEITSDNLTDWYTNKNWTWGVQYLYNNGDMMYSSDTPLHVTLTNRFRYAAGTMSLTKELAGHHDDWYEGDPPVFEAIIWGLGVDSDDPGEERQLIFESTNEHGTLYTYNNVGFLNGEGEQVFFDEDYPFEYFDFDIVGTVSFHVFDMTIGNTSNQTIIEGLRDNGTYRVEEINVSEDVTTEYFLGDSTNPLEGGIIVKDPDAEHSFTIRVVNTYPQNNDGTEPDPHIVTFDLDGGDEDEAFVSQTVNHEDNATNPGSPTKAGYKFTGWYLAPENEAFDFENTPIVASITLVARWAVDSPPAQVTVTFDANSGTFQIEEDDVDNEDDEDEGYEDDEEHDEDIADNEDDEETPAQITVRSVNSGESMANNTTGAEMPAPPSKEGYRFDGWHTDQEGDNNIGTWFTEDTRIDEPIIVYAQWSEEGSPQPFRVRFNLHGGTDADAFQDQLVESGELATEPIEIPTLSGYDFVGWYTDEFDGEVFNFATPIITDTEIHARWRPASDEFTPPPEEPEPDTTEPPPPPPPPPQPEEVEAVPAEVSFIEAYLVGIPNAEGVRQISPYTEMTRAEVATVFFRKATDEMREQFWVQENPFNDVELEDWFNNSVSTTVNMGLFHGVGDDTFAPTQSITRGELAAVLVRFMHINAEPFSAASTGRDQFNDISDHWARAYINEAATNGWAHGSHGIYGPFNPDQPISRAEAAAMFNRTFERQVETVDCLLPDMLAFPDKTSDAWYYTYLKLASNSYTYERREDNPLYKNLFSVIQPRDWTVLERPDSRLEHFSGLGT